MGRTGRTGRMGGLVPLGIVLSRRFLAIPLLPIQPFLPILPLMPYFLTVAPVNCAMAPSVVCAAFRPSRKSLSVYVANRSVG